MRRDPRARGSKGTSVAVAPRGGAPGGVARTITSHHGRNSPEDVYAIVANTIRTGGRSAAIEDTLALDGEPARCMTARRGRDGASGDQTFALDEPPFGVVPIQHAASPRLGAQNGIGIGSPGDPMYTCTTRGDHAVFAFDYQQLTSMENRSVVAPNRPSPTITRQAQIAVAGGLRPRRLTPREVERCFGFADDYTLVPGASDSSRYEALGNSMAVPVLGWLGRRMLAVESILRTR